MLSVVGVVGEQIYPDLLLVTVSIIATRSGCLLTYKAIWNGGVGVGVGVATSLSARRRRVSVLMNGPATHVHPRPLRPIINESNVHNFKPDFK